MADREWLNRLDVQLYLHLQSFVSFRPVREFHKQKNVSPGSKLQIASPTQWKLAKLLSKLFTWHSVCEWRWFNLNLILSWLNLLVTFYFEEYYTHKQSYYWLSNSSLNVFDLLFYLLVEASVYNGHSFIGKEKRSSRNVSTPKMSQYPPLRLVETEVAAIVNLTLLNKSNNAMFSACYGNIGCCIR